MEVGTHLLYNTVHACNTFVAKLLERFLPSKNEQTKNGDFLEIAIKLQQILSLRFRSKIPKYFVADVRNGI